MKNGPVGGGGGLVERETMRWHKVVSFLWPSVSRRVVMVGVWVEEERKARASDREMDPP